MKSRYSIFAVLLVALLALVGYGLFATSKRDPASVGASGAAMAAPAQRIADETALNTALELLKLPVSADESPLAQDALRLADKEMDLAFADAVQASSVQLQTPTPQVRAIERRLAHVQDDLAADDAQITELTASAAKATGARRAAVNDELSLARARLELDRDEADDAQQDLMRAGGDPQGRVQAVIDEHEASSRRADSTRIVISSPSAVQGMVKRIAAWWSLHQKELALQDAQSAAERAATSFAAQHAVLEQAAPQNVAGTDSTAAVGHSSVDSVRHRLAPGAAMSHEASAALLQNTVRLDAEQKARRRLDQHADNQRTLATAYEQWAHVVRNEERTAINRVLRSVTWILVILLLALLIDRYIEHVLRTISSDRRRTQTMCMVVRVSLQILAVLFALLVIFGMPNNLGTFLGLAGAGLTVALKDFIISFFGWFVLLGKDGIGIGDLVEINGVTGEVVELGMFHSVLLETGNWTESGHLTGRRVTFTNSFAIEGHYFNFSTSGQWLWDQVNIVVPAGRDPYPIVDALQRHVEAATADSAEKAEREWKGTPRSRRFSAVAAAPAINIKPVIGGTEITVRFLTHVRQRSELRSDLYHTAVDLLGEKPAGAPQPAVVAGE